MNKKFRAITKRTAAPMNIPFFRFDFFTVCFAAIMNSSFSTCHAIEPGIPAPGKHRIKNQNSSGVPIILSISYICNHIVMENNRE